MNTPARNGNSTAANSVPSLATGDAEAGGALIVALITMVVCVTIAFSALNIATRHQGDVHRAGAEVQARALAESGVQRAICFLEETMAKDPWQPIAAVDAVLLAGTSGSYRYATEEPLMKDGRRNGTYTVQLQTEVDGPARNVLITCTGYFPSREQAQAKSTVQAVVRLASGRGELFDYAYFIDHWGWFYGDTIASHGNARVNGPFDAADPASGVHGTPRYGGRAGDDLLAYRDDNRDGLRDGNDGGIYAGWGISGTDNVTGMGGQVENQHDFLEQVPMPNLARLDEYEQKALVAGSGVELGGQLDAGGNPAPNLGLCDEVQGDEAGEVPNLVLIGTAAEPLVLNGPVVVRGDVIIKGVVSGQGAIYAGGNVYVADDLVYLDPPTPLPTGGSETDTEAWLTANSGKDFLGLFARGHVVLGDHEDDDWRYPVGWWLDHAMNDSSEDCGVDQIPMTAAGKDGIPGTEDDDTLEGDGQWTTQTYSDGDAALGLIPSGYAVGDPIPGTGEDIDGDGVQDDGITLQDFDLSCSLGSGCWAGNLPDGTVCYDELASMTMTHVDASIFTPHALAMVTLATGQDFEFFGSVACRNESVLYATDSMNFVHDRRLTAGGPFRSMMPTAPPRAVVLGWKVLEDGDVETAVPAF